MADNGPCEAEEFWDDLLAFVEDGRVMPVVGPALLQIEDDGATVPFYQAVARRLLRKYGVAEDAAWPGGESQLVENELNDAVALLAAKGVKRVRDLYRPIHEIIGELAAQVPDSLPVLRDLATITHFDLFATITPDRLLARALNVTRFEGLEQTDEIEYAPKLPTDRRHDIPGAPTSRYTAVFHLFGRADVQPFFAIHDEDTLEFAYMLQHGGGPERFFSQMRSQNLLFIGCNLSEWLSRFFIRMSNTERLYSADRSNAEFVVGRDARKDGDLTVFLERFSQNSHCYPTDPIEFVAELAERWKVRNAALAAGAPAGEGTLAPATPTGPGTVFISYAHEDAGAAKALFGSLQEIGADVAWYDKSALLPGDDWEAAIRGAIQRCAVFMPILSANTERRTEGYFRLEWKQAAEREGRIQGRKFIFPVVVDPESAGMAYELVPEAFKAFQYSHAPAGQMPPPLRDELRQQLRAIRRGRSP